MSPSTPDAARDAAGLVPAGAHVLGEPGAAVTIVEFGDLECPYCRDAAPVLRDAVASSGGQVRLVFRHFPLFAVHPHALTAALAAEAAAQAGAFWAMHDALFAHQDDLTDAGLARVAASLGVDGLDGAAVVGQAAQRFGDVVERDYADAVAAGVEGTPTVFVDGARLTGRITRASVRAAVDAARARQRG
ncbi:DsbA family protein [Cellulomonas sp. PhB143]|uniref:DsbA family protein n=1 Tax=Cellulomonas sp. PhB143 TaxID=2485186 RepID=UPI000F47AA33|nr:DsbA family protein [Cellulomonas sp. PhB143]ROS76873.1 protein-disulfide isomerase [Cellulomonas sp. PhB143]